MNRDPMPDPSPPPDAPTADTPLADDASWHAQPVADALAALGATAEGLSESEARRRLTAVGPNRLPRTAPVPAVRILLDQLSSVVVWLLLAALAISLVLGDVPESIAIAVVIAINTVLGFVTELRARRAMEALRAFESDRAAVRRDGELRQVDASTLVPGDVVEVSTGERVPADGRLLDGVDLRLDEAALTGESMPVRKEPDAVLPVETTLADRTNLVFKGTVVAAGTGRMAVTATGVRTEIGRIGALVGAVEDERTPLERRLDTLGRRLAWAAMIVAAAVAGVGALQGVPLGLTLELGIALAVAAVPEALPAVATIALAVGLHRMARREALVRRLPAVEALGSTTVVCTDKTRTLTSGDMTVVRIWAGGQAVDPATLSEGGDDPSARAARAVVATAALASRARAGDGSGDGPPADPVDAAMIRAAGAAGIDLAAAAPGEAAGLLPFSSERQLMAMFHADGDETAAMVKGAPRRVLDACDRQRVGDDVVPLDDAGRESLMEVNSGLAAQALRVLAVARGSVAGTDESDVTGLTFLGFVGLMDPPADGVRETIARLQTAGLRTIMVTGDQRRTAEAIGRQLGLPVLDVASIDGPELAAMSDEDLARRIGDLTILSRVSPRQKLRIVDALQARGEVVAMLGDGVNDAPALKRADVGVAMGRRGTDVAREAADIVLQDDRFETVGAAVEEGRVIYANIRKFVFYLFSCNVAEVLVLMAAGLAGWPHPLLPLQILWLNMVTDTFPALALALEPADPAAMRRPPRPPREALLSGPFLRAMAAYAVLITVVTLAAFVMVGTGAADLEHARTMAFMTLAFAQILHLGNARSTGPVVSARRIVANPWALGAVGLAVGLQVLTVQVPLLRDVLGLSWLTSSDWLIVIGLGAVPAVAGQGVKLLRVAR